MKKWKVPVVWEMMAYLTVEAETADEAASKALDLVRTCPLPENGEYLEDSFTIDEDGEPFETQ